MRVYWLLAAVLLHAVLLPAYGQNRTIVVASDGSGDFRTVQEALASVAPGNAGRTVIHIRAGTYRGPIQVAVDRPRITFEGEGTDQTILTWDRNVYDPKVEGHDSLNPTVVIHGDDFIATHLTICNTSGDHGQALAVKIDGDRALFFDCRLEAWQDTLLMENKRCYFENCYVAGRVDFIYGSAAAWFENSEIHSRNGGHVTAASTPQEQKFGFVFMRCRLTADNLAWNPATTNPASTQKMRVTPRADLGRPWRPYAAVAYIRCEIGDHIIPQGWNNWGKLSNEQTARYFEYNNTGPGANTEKRAAWTHQLTDEQARDYTVANVLGGTDRWDPQAVVRLLKK